jgi:hypothetical protein
MNIANTNACRKTYLGEPINDSLRNPIPHLHLKTSETVWLSISNSIYTTISDSVYVLVRETVVNPLTIRL